MDISMLQKEREIQRLVTKIDQFVQMAGTTWAFQFFMAYYIYYCIVLCYKHTVFPLFTSWLYCDVQVSEHMHALTEILIVSCNVCCSIDCNAWLLWLQYHYVTLNWRYFYWSTMVTPVSSMQTIVITYLSFFCMHIYKI